MDPFLWLFSFAGLLLETTPLFAIVPAYGTFLPDSLLFLARWFILRAIIAAPIAYFAKRKGYSWWGFFLVAWMFMPAASIAMVLALPKLKGGKVVPSK